MLYIFLNGSWQNNRIRDYAWNPDAWRQASDVTAKAANLRNKKYLMVHGTADDNVHYQQSMMLARAMEEADVLFRCTMFHTKVAAKLCAFSSGET